MHRQGEMQIGLTADEKQQLEGVTLQQLLPASKAESFQFSSAYRGVSFNKAFHKFLARINVSSKALFLGHYDNEQEAARAYDRAAMKHHGR
ncbi:TPA: AP-2 complex subunit beta [Trebouxia sp. C0004]